MERLRQAFLRFDRRHGGAEPPPKAQVFVARHPVGTGLVFGGVMGLAPAWAVSAFGDPVLLLQASLIGLVAGLFAWLSCRIERRRQAHYERHGGFRRNSPQPQPLLHEVPPVWHEGMVWLGFWTVYTVAFWLIGYLRPSPFSWVQSAFYAGFAVIGSWIVHLIKERRRRGR